MKLKQYIVVNKELMMSSGKLAAQVSHASMAFLSTAIRDSIKESGEYMPNIDDNPATIRFPMEINADIYNGWIDEAFTKVVLSAKNENRLERVKREAVELGFKEGRDFFCIRDNCLTELEPDETGTRFTCIGFAPMEPGALDAVVGKLQLYK